MAVFGIQRFLGVTDGVSNYRFFGGCYDQDQQVNFVIIFVYVMIDDVIKVIFEVGVVGVCFDVIFKVR